MHDEDHYDCIDTLVVKGLKQTDPLLYGLNLNHLAHILMYGWGRSISAL